MTGALTGTTVAVVGLGPMGRGIARVFAGAGARVLVVDISPEATEAALARTAADAAAEGTELGDVTMDLTEYNRN